MENRVREEINRLKRRISSQRGRMEYTKKWIADAGRDVRFVKSNVESEEKELERVKGTANEKSVREALKFANKWLVSEKEYLAKREEIGKMFEEELKESEKRPKELKE